MLQGLSNDQINYGMKHFLSKMDVDKITNGEHPQFSALDKLDILIRGALNKKLAENMKYTASVNERLMLHYEKEQVGQYASPGRHLAARLGDPVAGPRS